MEADETSDTRGLKCPMPLLEMSTKIKEMRSGQVLEVWVDDPAFEPDVIAWCKLMRCKLLEVKKEGNIIKAYIKKS